MSFSRDNVRHAPMRPRNYVTVLSIALSEKAAKVKNDTLSNKLAQLSDDVLKYKSVRELIQSKKFSSLELSMMKFAMENNDTL